MSSTIDAILRLRTGLEAGPGQGMLEYGLLLVAVPLVVITAVFLFGAQVGALLSTAGSSLP